MKYNSYLKAGIFLWPVSNLPALSSLTDSVGAQSVETILESKYPNAHPVLFSSARAALTAYLEYAGIKRMDHVWCPEFSSHCVLEAIARVGTPTTVVTSSMKAVLVYNQWGFVQNVDLPAELKVIDDSVDTLFIPGCKVIPDGADCTLWSLPKALGTVGGGVIFCRSPEDAEALKEIRRERGTSLLQIVMRMIAKKSARVADLWNGTEASQGGLEDFAVTQIKSVLEKIDDICAERLDVLALASKDLADKARASGRLPSNIPLVINDKTKTLVPNILTAGVRHFNVNMSCAKPVWEKVIPLPVHIDIDAQQMRYFLEIAGADSVLDVSNAQVTPYRHIQGQR